LLIPHRAQVVFHDRGGSKHVFFLHFHSLLHTVARNQNESGERCKHAGLSVAGFFLHSARNANIIKRCFVMRFELKLFCLFVLVYIKTWFWYGTTFLSNRKALGVD
jgi:hypothetical protein